MADQSNDYSRGQTDAQIETLKASIQELKGMCEKCMIRKIVWGAMVVMGTAVGAALMAFILRGGLK